MDPATDVQQVEVVNQVETNRTAETVIATPNGEIHVIHEVTIGDILLLTMISFLLIWQLLERVIRRV